MTSTDEMRSLAIRAHAHQQRNAGRVPYSFHVLSVAAIVKELLDGGGECSDPDLAHDIVLAAMGHDLYEDTDVTRADIKEKFGARVDALIYGMTNPNGDDDRAAYEREMGHALEEVRLIKLADLIDNVLSCAYGIHDLGRRWINNTFLPIAEGMAKTVRATNYSRYPQTSARAIELLDFALARLRSNLAIFVALPAQGQIVPMPNVTHPPPATLTLDIDAQEERERREGWLYKGMRSFKDNGNE
ncbi:MAG TPA: HD domain-containing protein [Kofleriaceae bacterium]